jgi:hypothetical protein
VTEKVQSQLMVVCFTVSSGTVTLSNVERAITIAGNAFNIQNLVNIIRILFK